MTSPEEVRLMFKRIDENILNMRDDFKTLEKSVNELKKEYNTTVLPNVKTWNDSADNQKWVVRILVGAVIAAVLAVIGLN